MNNLMVNSAIRSFLPGLNYAIIDEELLEMLAVYSTVLSAPKNSIFRMIDIGARWGTWGARAVAYGRKMRPDLKYDLLFIEPHEGHCIGIKEVMSINNINEKEYRIIPTIAKESEIIDWINERDMIDLVDMDIQGDEKNLTESKEFMEILSKKARRVIIGTHWTRELHEFVKNSFSSMKHNSDNILKRENNNNNNEFESNNTLWRILSEMPWTKNTTCLAESVRNSRMNWPGKWDIAFAGEGCTHDTRDYGSIIQADGELIFENINLPYNKEFCEVRIS
jgi:hypothetical protein